MRVIGGKARGCRLFDPGRSMKIRPTPDRVREALFNMIDVEGKAFCDLFSGTGANGCEAVSRSAARVTMVDNQKPALLLIKKNIEKVKSVAEADTGVDIRSSDSIKFLDGESRKYHWIFCDPPYEWTLYGELLRSVADNGLLEPDGDLILETSSRRMPETGFEPYRSKRYGDTTLHFYRLCE